MGTQAWVVFILVGGIIWGGFISFLVVGLCREAAKNRDSRP